MLPGPVAKLRHAYPKVNVSLHQGSPDQVARMLIEEVAEIGVATESLTNYPDLVTHALLRMAARAGVSARPPAGGAGAHHAGRPGAGAAGDLSPKLHWPHTRIDQAFALRHLRPNIVLEAIDSDVIKTYVKLGMGVGIVAEMAMQGENATPDLVARPGAQLFGHNLARVAFKRGSYLRQFVLRFAELMRRPPLA